MKTAGFTREERLKSRKAIETLMRHGRRSSHQDLTMVYGVVEEDRPLPVKVAFAVPKRQFKSAVDRNLLKRRMREAYRKNKQELFENLSSQKTAFDVMFIYQSSHILTYADIEEKIVLLLKGLMKGHE